MKYKDWAMVVAILLGGLFGYFLDDGIRWMSNPKLPKLNEPTPVMVGEPKPSEPTFAGWRGCARIVVTSRVHPAYARRDSGWLLDYYFHPPDIVTLECLKSDAVLSDESGEKGKGQQR